MNASTPPGDRSHDLAQLREHLQQQSTQTASDTLPAATLERFQELAERQAAFESHSLTDNSKRAYQHDQEAYARWCEQYQVPPLPVRADIVAIYLTELADQIKDDGTHRYKTSSLRRIVAALARLRYDTGGGRGLGTDERVSATINGIARERATPKSKGGVAEKRDPRGALVLEDLVDLIGVMDHSTWPAGVTAARDTLAILIGFTLALRRENAAELTVENFVLDHKTGIKVWLGKSKTDQTGEGAWLAAPFGQVPATCLPCAWHRWSSLAAAGSLKDRMALVLATPPNPADWEHVCHGEWPALPPDAPVLARVTKAGNINLQHLTGAALYKRLVIRVAQAHEKFKKTQPHRFLPGKYGFHSLRAGFVTQALIEKASHKEIRNQTLHKSDFMVDQYDRDEQPLRNNAVTKLGL